MAEDLFERQAAVLRSCHAVMLEHVKMLTFVRQVFLEQATSEARVTPEACLRQVAAADTLLVSALETLADVEEYAGINPARTPLAPDWWV